jgi:hypothetical protein
VVCNYRIVLKIPKEKEEDNKIERKRRNSEK